MSKTVFDWIRFKYSNRFAVKGLMYKIDQSWLSVIFRLSNTDAMGFSGRQILRHVYKRHTHTHTNLMFVHSGKLSKHSSQW